MAHKVWPLLTNNSSGRRVGDAGGRRSRDVSHNPSHDLSHERISRSIPRTDLRGRTRRRWSSKKDQSYDLSTGINTSGTAIRQRSAVQRRMPPRKLERENPSEFRYRLESK